MKIAEIFRDMQRLIEAALQEIDGTIEKSTGEKKEAYLDYRKDFRQIGIILSQVMAKMRLDKRFDPEEEKDLMKLSYQMPQQEED
jgi:hypothetical protein